MSELILAIKFTSDQDGLPEFSAYLRKLSFPHRLSEYQEGLALWVYQESHVSVINDLYQRYLDDNLPDVAINPVRSAITQTIWRNYLATLLFLLFSVIGFLGVKFQWFSLIELFSFQGFHIEGGSMALNSPFIAIQNITNGEVWRLLTPIFLHFDLMHIAFNMTFLWYFSNQIERTEGRFLIIAYIVITGVISNMAQFIMVPENLFGGMSGVNYGLLAYCFLTNYLSGRKIYNFPAGFFWFSVVMLLLGFSGAFLLIGYSIANWAHLGGLLTGLLIAVVIYFKNRSQVS